MSKKEIAELTKKASEASATVRRTVEEATAKLDKRIADLRERVLPKPRRASRELPVAR